MTGSSSAPRRCFIVDGCAGADLIAAMRGRDARLQVVDSPRQADLLLVLEPVSDALTSAAAGAYRAMPRPRRIATTGRTDPSRADEVIDRLVRSDALTDERDIASEIEPFTVPLPPKEEREIATELAVIALGPLQKMTAGPLRIILVCDGEQVVRADVQRGFAARGLAARMRGRPLGEATELARLIAPLSPVASEAAFARAVGRGDGDDDAIAIERARSHMWWTERFATLMGIEWLARAARSIAGAPTFSSAGVEGLLRRVEGDRLMRIRFRGVGRIGASLLEERGVTGPVLDASKHGHGDVLARLLTRLREAAAADSALVRTARGDLVVEATHDGQRLLDLTWRAPSAPLIDLIPELVRDQKLADAEAIIASLDIATAEVDG
ncbi:MAG: hypothetical protein M3041_11790 [Acidobacteriota bacterium]|nr:hypothetical protein [Acidobacteriota bacterium]